jgi:hypothetical protein
MAIGRGAFKPLTAGGSVVKRTAKPSSRKKPRKRRRSTSENYTQNKANASGSTRPV